MELNYKLRELRLSKNLTQENVAEYLNVSSQTVSKWERGLLSPDISLLPKIALLYHCSIDSIFDMDSVWGIEHRKEFEEKIRLLRNQNDWEGIYKAWMQEIDLHPDRFSDYPNVMGHIFRNKLLDDEHINRMLSLADYAERHCLDDDIRNEIYRIMLQICAESGTPQIRKKTKYYYQKLPLLKHSREVYCRCALTDEEYDYQVKQNIFYTIDICECAVRQLVSDNMTSEEQLFYYQKAAALYETVLDEKYGGVYDIPLLWDYAKIAELFWEMGDEGRTELYINRILNILERHLSETDKQTISVFLYSSAPPNTVPIEKNCIRLLNALVKNEKFSKFHEKISLFLQRYSAHFQKIGCISK